MTSTDYSENALVEQPAIALFEELGWPSVICFYEKVGATVFGVKPIFSLYESLTGYYCSLTIKR